MCREEPEGWSDWQRKQLEDWQKHYYWLESPSVEDLLEEVGENLDEDERRDVSKNRTGRLRCSLVTRKLLEIPHFKLSMSSSTSQTLLAEGFRNRGAEVIC